MTDMRCIQFRSGASQGYQGERVVPFDGQRRAPWEVLELRRAQPFMKASGWWKGLLMRDRQDAQAARTRVIERTPESSDPHREPSERLLEAWAPVEGELRRAVDEEIFAVWLADVHPHRLVNGEWVLACRPQARGWIRDRFGRLIASCADRPVVFVNCENDQRRTS